MEVAVITTDKEGISTTLVGQQTMEALEKQGVKVVPIYTDGKAGSAINCKEVSRRHTICLLEHKIPAIHAQARYARPLTLTSVWTGNVEGYSPPDLAHYVMHFFGGKYQGIHTKHVSHSLHTAEMLNDVVRETFKPSLFGEWSKGNTCHLYGIAEEFEPGDNAADNLIAPMNRVSNGAKNITLHSAITSDYQNALAQHNIKAETAFYYAPGFGPDDKQLKADMSVYHWHEQPKDRAEYVANASKVGMFLSTSLYESFGIYYLELLCSGAVGVFLDRPWVRQLIPGYPYIVKSNELLDCMLHVRKNYAEARENLLKNIIPALRVTFNLDTFAQGLISTIEGMEAKKK